MNWIKFFKGESIINKYYFCISLRVKHPDKDLTELTQILSLRPKRFWKVGEPRTTPRGELLKGTYTENYWSAQVHEEKYIYSIDTDISDYLERLNQRLEKHNDLFLEIVSSGGHIENFIGWFGDSNIGMELSPELLGNISKLNIALSLDVYAK